MTNNTNPRYSRYADILPPDKLQSAHCLVVGVGAIGRQVALQLGSMGVGELTLVDHDKVSPENLGTQGFRPGDVGSYKVESVTSDLVLINPDLNINTRADKFHVSTIPRDVDVDNYYAFMCVDSISTRKTLFDIFTRKKLKFFVDGRMSSEVVRILPVTPEYRSSLLSYEDSLFAEEEAHQGSCTAKSTIYTANIAAGMMVQQFSKYIRGIPLDDDVLINLLTNEITVQSLMTELSRPEVVLL